MRAPLPSATLITCVTPSHFPQGKYVRQTQNACSRFHGDTARYSAKRASALVLYCDHRLAAETVTGSARRHRKIAQSTYSEAAGTLRTCKDTWNASSCRSTR
jgi:hypothetical protein